MEAILSELAIRECEESDLDFILNSFLKSYHESPECKHITNTVYFSYFKNLIIEVCKNNTILLAVNRDDPNFIYGYIVYNSDLDLVHYVYVKYTFRHLGISKILQQATCIAPEKIRFISFLTNKAIEWIKQDPRLIYNPSLRS